MIAALLSALILAGAPAQTPVRCEQAPLAGGAWGLTYWADRSIGLYGPVGCFAPVYASDSTIQRFRVSELNPGVNIPEVVGEGLLLDLHESSHVGLNSLDECRVENAAFVLLPTLLAQYFNPTETPQLLAYASAYNSFILAHYGCV